MLKQQVIASKLPTKIEKEGDEVSMTDNEIIDLYIAIWKAFNTVYHVKYPKEDISFDPFNKKFRKYFA